LSLQALFSAGVTGDTGVFGNHLMEIITISASSQVMTRHAHSIDRRFSLDLSRCRFSSPGGSMFSRWRSELKHATTDTLVGQQIETSQIGIDTLQRTRV
jgi:hypothetical protein